MLTLAGVTFPLPVHLLLLGPLLSLSLALSSTHLVCAVCAGRFPVPVRQVSLARAGHVCVMLACQRLTLDLCVCEPVPVCEMREGEYACTVCVYVYVCVCC